MAKFMIVSLALVAMAAFIEASPIVREESGADEAVADQKQDVIGAETKLGTISENEIVIPVTLELPREQLEQLLKQLKEHGIDLDSVPMDQQEELSSFFEQAAGKLNLV